MDGDGNDSSVFNWASAAGGHVDAAVDFGTNDPKNVSSGLR
jgi:hypothetical protein